MATTDRNSLSDMPWSVRVVRLLVGLALLGGPTALLMSGVTPPGPAGELLRHNRECRIDASPLFYSEVENMAQLEAALRLRRANSREP